MAEQKELKELAPLCGFRRHMNADIATNTALNFPLHPTQSGICSVCILCSKCEIGKKARTGTTEYPRPFGVQFGAEKRLPNIEDLQILPELYGEGIRFHSLSTETKISGFKFKAPLAVAAMGSTQVAHIRGKALAEGAAKAGIGLVIGENILATHGIEGMNERTKPFLKHYNGFGALVVQGNVHDIRMGVFKEAKKLGAHAVEVKLGQGAKQGLGGTVEFDGKENAEKYLKLGYHVDELGPNHYQRHAEPGSISDKALEKNLVEYASLGLPIWLKIAVGAGLTKLIATLETIKRDCKVPIKCLTVDGHGGGTGLSPWQIMNECSLPSASLFGALKKKPPFDILLAGGYANGIDCAKAMMLGATGIAMGRAFLIAAATDSANGVLNFTNAISEELKMACATQRVKSPSELSTKRKNLFALSDEAAKLFAVNSAPEKII